MNFSKDNAVAHRLIVPKYLVQWAFPAPQQIQLLRFSI